MVAGGLGLGSGVAGTIADYVGDGTFAAETVSQAGALGGFLAGGTGLAIDGIGAVQSWDESKSEGERGGETKMSRGECE
jgi:hypothetical protein